MVQPRVDCAFDPALGQACLDSVQALIDGTPEMWRVEDLGTFCTCGDTSSGGPWTVDWQSQTCTDMPQADALPAACDTVCTDL